MSVRLWTASSVLCLTAGLASAATRPGAPTLVSPVGDITERRPIYTWKPVVDATHYVLRVDGPTGLRVLLPVVGSRNCNATACTIQPPITLGLGAHRWQVGALNRAGLGP